MNKISKALLCTAAIFSIAGCGVKKNKSYERFDDQPLTFEEQYLSKKFNYAEGGKFALSVISGLGSIAAGVAFDSPTAIVSGAFSLLTSINDQFNGNKGPTIANVMNKLNEMDQKLDQIDEKLDKNYTQLSEEVIRTQAMVDQVLLEEQDQAIRFFNTNYVEKVDDFQRDFSDYIEQSFKSYISENQIADIRMEKGKDGWALVPIMDIADAEARNLRFEIRDFPKAKEFLQENYNIVAKGFMDKLSEDIDQNMNGVELPEGLTVSYARNMVIANTVEKFTKQYYLDNHAKALELRNLVINYSKQVSGKASKSIIDTYINRMKYMFNFAGEMKNYSYGALANIEYSLDVNAALAAQACLYSGVNQEEIRSEYLDARDVITNHYEAIKETPDNYSFLTNTKVGSGFYRARFETNYSNIGNSPKFSSKLAFNKVAIEKVDPIYTDDDPYQHSYLTEVDHMRIRTRMNLMMLNGLETGTNYIDYLKNINVVSNQDYNTCRKLINRDWISEDSLRFFTGLTIRDMSDKDKSFTIQCVNKGNNNADYFKIGWVGTYKGNHTADCWKGKIAETTYIDAKTGTTMQDKRVCAYATYSESHWYWSNDEYWSFVDNPVGNYFFILENIA